VVILLLLVMVIEYVFVLMASHALYIIRVILVRFAVVLVNHVSRL
jgi:hypothetical protein